MYLLPTSFMIISITWAVYELRGFYASLKSTPDVDDPEMLFALQYANNKTSVKVCYIVSFLLRLLISVLPLMYIIYVCGASMLQQIIGIIISVVINVSISVLPTEYEFKVYQEGLRLAWLCTKSEL